MTDLGFLFVPWLLFGWMGFILWEEHHTPAVAIFFPLFFGFFQLYAIWRFVNVYRESRQDAWPDRPDRRSSGTFEEREVDRVQALMEAETEQERRRLLAQIPRDENDGIDRGTTGLDR